MPYFKLKLDINQEVLTRLRALPVRAQQNIKTLIATELAPELQQNTDALMDQGPDRSAPMFNTAKSAWYYLYVMIPQGLVPNDGTHYVRQDGPDSVQGGFKVEVSTTRFSVGMIQIRNLHPNAKYVFGPWAVQMHINTGWPEQAELARQLLREKAVSEINRLWKQAVTMAAKGQTLE